MRTRELIREAKKLGRDAGHAAGTWVFDGNTSDETYRRVLNGIVDRDPEVLDSFNVPNLSGEWADGPTSDSLCSDLGMSDEDERLDEVCSAWEDAASDAFWAEVERMARRQVAA